VIEKPTPPVELLAESSFPKYNLLRVDKDDIYTVSTVPAVIGVFNGDTYILEVQVPLPCVTPLGVNVIKLYG
jgi:hypothetical protein